MYPDATLAALFLAGLLGGVHCAAMCGGIVGALGMLAEGPRRPVATPAARVSRRLAPLLAYNGGRLASYTLLGAAAGAAGSFGWLLGEALPVQQLAYAASSALLVVMGLHVAGERRSARLVEGIGSGVWRRVRPAATAALGRAGSPGGAVVAGALWGLVPCGMVYTALAGALLAGSAERGAALMLAFGLGTLPNLLLLGSGAGVLARLSRRRSMRLPAGLAIALFGVLGFLRLDVAGDVPLLRELCVRLPVP